MVPGTEAGLGPSQGELGSKGDVDVNWQSRPLSAGVVFVGARHRLPNGLTDFDRVSTGRANLTNSGVRVVGVFVDAAVYEFRIKPTEPFVGCQSRCHAFDDATFRRGGLLRLKLVPAPMSPTVRPFG